MFPLTPLGKKILYMESIRINGFCLMTMFSKYSTAFSPMLTVVLQVL